MKNMPKTLARFALHFADVAVKKTNIGAAMLTGKNRHIFEGMVQRFSEILTGPDVMSSGAKVHELGFDNRASLMERMKRIWQETTEYADRADEENTWKDARVRLGTAAAIPIKTLRAVFDKIGVQQYDFAINATALTYSQWLAKRLEEVAMVYGDERVRKGLTKFDATNHDWELQSHEWSAFNLKQENEDSLAFFRLFMESSASQEGFQLERSLWDYYQKKKAGHHAEIFTPSQMDAVQRKLLADFNASTPINRPSGSSANAVVRNLLALQGYVSDGLLKVIDTSFGGANRDRSLLAIAVGKLPMLAMLALMSVIIGYVQAAVTGLWEKKMRGRMTSLANPLDADFWSSWKRWGDGTFRLGMAQIMLLGDLVLAARGEIQGNRGFDPVGKVLVISYANRLFNAFRGVYNTAKSGGTFKDSVVPLLDVLRSSFPLMLEAEHLFGKASGPLKQTERIQRVEAQLQGLLEGRSGFQPPSYGPTTVIRRNLGDAVGRWFMASKEGDATRAASELATAKTEIAKLEEFHYRKYLAAGKDEFTARKNAQKDTFNDYQDINPVVAAMLGKRPTEEQYQLIMSGITGDRRAVVDQGMAAWKAGAMELFGKQGSITREEAAASRAGQGTALPGLGLPRMNVRGTGGTSTGGTMRRSAASSRSTGHSSLVKSTSTLRNLSSSMRRAAGVSRPKLGASLVRKQKAFGSTKTKRLRSSFSKPIKVRKPILGSKRRRAYAVV